MDTPEYDVKLIKLAERDLAVRERLLKENQLNSGYHPEMEWVHRENAEALRQIITEIGFPGISKVGKEAYEAAWLIAQHAIGEPELMKEFYRLMDENIQDIDQKHRAYLYDRIQFFQGKPQRYGTQLNADGSIYPVMDMDNLNELRSDCDLPSISKTDIDRISAVETIERIENENPDYVKWRNDAGWK